jgi:D-xylose transport system substrate-binding protein
VAQEIKTLAQRTAESAKEIENLILKTQESVDLAIRAIEEGSMRVAENMKLSEQADHFMAEVVRRAEVASQNAREIAKDTDAQAAVSAQVSTAADEIAKRSELIRTAMREQEDSSRFVQERAVKMQDLMATVAQAMAEQAESSRRISTAMDQLTSRIQGIRVATDDQTRSSAAVGHATDTIKKKADLVAISAQNVSNTSMSVLHQSLLLRHELKGVKLPEREAAVTLGVVFDNLREERWQRERDFFHTKTAELGMKMEFRVAEGDADKQKAQGEELVNLGVDLMIVVAVDAEAAATIVERAKKAKIPVIAYDRLIKNCDLNLFVSFNAVKIGEIQALTTLEKAKGNRFLILAGSPADVNALMLYRGQMKVLKPKIEQGQVVITDEVWVPDWDPRQAYELTRKAIEKKGPVDAVIASNDGTAGGAIRAVKELITDRKVVVTGMDTELSACQRIIAGSQTMTVYMPIKLQASRALEAALLILRGEEIPGITDFVDNGKAHVPAILLRPTKVDADNLEEVVIKDGFHRREDLPIVASST